MRLYAMLAAAAVATFAATPAVGQLGYALYTQWNNTTLPLADCKRRGERALRKAGFSDDFVTTSNSVYGRRKGGYTAAARCVTSKKFVFFAISGPKGDLSSKYLNEIAKNY